MKPRQRKPQPKRDDFKPRTKAGQFPPKLHIPSNVRCGSGTKDGIDP